jgi:hypothetical protein
LEESNTAYLDKFVDQFFAALRVSLNDATAGVRANARKCFCACQNHWREKSKKFFSTLDPSTQKAIIEEEQKYNRLSTDTDGTHGAPRSKSSYSNRSGNETSSTLKPKPSTNYSIPKSKSSSAFVEISSLLDLDDEPSTNNELYSKPPKSGVGPKKPTATSSIQAAKKAWLAKKLPLKTEEDRISVVAPQKAQISEKSRGVVFSNRDEDDDEVFTEESDYHPIVPVITQTAPSGYAKPVSSYVNDVRQTPVVQATITQEVRPSTVPTRTVEANNSNTSIAKKIQLTNIEIPALSNTDTLATIIRDVKAPKSTNGSTAALSDRVLSCKKIMELVQSNDRWNELFPRFNDIMNILLDKFAIDPHHKVVELCLNLLQAMIPKYHQAFELYLERVFNTVLIRLSDNKDTVQHAAQALLSTIGNNYSGDVLAPILLKVMDNSNTKIKLGCLEFFMHVIPHAGAYLCYPSHMKLCLLKLVSQINRTSGVHHIQDATTATLNMLYRTQQQLFLEQLLLLSLTDQNIIKNILSKSITNLDNELLKVSRTSRGGAKSKMDSYEQHDNSMDEKQAKELYSTGNKTQSGTVKLTRQNSNGTLSGDSDDLSLLLSGLTRPKQDPKTLKHILTKARSISQNRDDSDEIWSLQSAKLIFTVLELIHNEDEGVREEALYLIKSLLQYHPNRFIETTTDGLTFKRVMHKYSDPVRAVHTAAEKVAECFVQNIEPLKTLGFLEPTLLNANEAILLGALRLLRLMIIATRNQPESELNPVTLRSHVPKLLPALTEAFNHDNPDIRKAVVYCLAEMLFTVGEQFQPLLSKRLSQSQVKLVMVYYQQLRTIQSRQNETDKMEDDDMVT